MYAYTLSCVQLFTATAYQAPLPMELSQQECWSELPFSPPGDQPNAGIELSPALQAGFFTNEPPGKPMYDVY